MRKQIIKNIMFYFVLMLCLNACHDNQTSFTVTPEGDGYETITPGSEIVDNGWSARFRIKINNGHSILRTVGGTCPTGSWSDSTYTTGAITSSCTVRFSTTVYAYIVNFNNNTVSICPVSSDGSFGICSSSNASDQQGNTTLNSPDSIALNPRQNMAYIGNFNASNSCNGGTPGVSWITLCHIHIDGSFGTCNTLNDPAFSGIAGLAFSPDGRYLYVSNSCAGTLPPLGSVSSCPVNPEDGTLNTCTSYSNFSPQITFGYTQFVGVQTAANEVVSLYTNANENQLSVAICPLNNGVIETTCSQTSYANTSIAHPQGISFNSTNTYAYVGNEGVNTVSICPLNSNGLITTCTISTQPTFNFSENSGVGLFMSSVNGYGYIPNDGNNTVSICQINSTDGSLSNCNASQGLNSSGANTFNWPSAITLRGAHD